MQQVEVKKVSAGTVYKIFIIGLTFGFLPLFLLFGIMGALGMDSVTFNEESVTGVKALFVGPLMAVLMSLIFTAILGSICALGLWIYSFFKSITIEFSICENQK